MSLLPLTVRTEAIPFFLLLGLGVGSCLSAQTPILTFPNGEDRWGYVRSHPDDETAGITVSAGQSEVSYTAVFGADIPRNPAVSYPSDAWDTPSFFGGYLLYTDNQSNGDYNPNFVRTVSGASEGRGHISLPVTTLVNGASSGNITNSVFGTFVTDSPLAGEGEFRVFIKENTIDHPDANGGSIMIRGAAFDGTRWLVTVDSAVVPNAGADHATVTTREGWLELNTDDFSYGTEPTMPLGTLSQSGIWFLASETATPDEVGFIFGLSDAYFTMRDPVVDYTADTSGDNVISLPELLRVIELYNTRRSSVRTGRYAPSESADDGFTPDYENQADAMALFDRYHGSDSDRDGVLSLSELLRVIELYNTRSGSMRTGKYRFDMTTEDGVAPDPEN